jgi:26S proteasome regulatory subunit T5
MSALPPAEHPNNNDLQNEPETATEAPLEAAEMDTTPDQPVEETWEDIPEDIMELEKEDILTRIRLIENDIKVRRGYLEGVSRMNVETRSCAQSSCG